jgi:energy-coupling factor transport system permease protein
VIGLDPRTRLGVVLAVGLAGLLLDRPASLLALVLVAGGVAGAVLGPRGRGALLVSATALLWSAALSQGLFSVEHPRHVLVQVGPVPIWREGVAWGLVQGGRFVASAAAAAALVATTPPDALLKALVGIRVPTGLAVLAVASLRSAPLVLNEAALAWRSRRSRRPDEWRLVSARALAVPVLARTLRRAGVLAEVLDARGFDIVDGLLDPPAPLPLGDRALLGALALAVAALAALEVAVSARAWGLFWDPAWEPVLWWAAVWL